MNLLETVIFIILITVSTYYYHRIDNLQLCPEYCEINHVHNYGNLYKGEERCQSLEVEVTQDSLPVMRTYI